MENFEIIDAHVHLSRTIEEEAENWPRPGRRECERYGTPERALSYMDMAGISKMAVMNLVPRQFRASLADKAKLPGLPEERRRAEEERIAQQIGPLVREFNEWGCETGRRFPRLIPFICVSRELGDAGAIVDEVVLRAKQGARGIKLHPAMFRLSPNDRELWPMYARCQELGLPVLADSAPLTRPRVLAMYPYSFDLNAYRPPVEYGEPENFAPVLEEFPQLKLILAHLGAPWWDERIDLARRYPNVCFDTSQGFTAPDQLPVNPHRGLAEEDAVRVMRKIGVERVLFGTDFPPLAPQPQLEQLLRLPLSSEEKRAILSGNAKRILGI